MFAATKSFFAKAPAGGALTPAWSIDWSTGTPSGYTLTRASSGTYVDSSGYIASASTDVARLTHNSSGTRLGLLVEESRTNLAQRSEDMSNGYWTKSGLLAFGSGSTVDAAAAPDNTTTADLITEDTSNGSHYVQRDFLTTTINTTYVGSVYIKKPTTNARQYVMLTWSANAGHRARVVFDLTAGTATDNGLAGTNFIAYRKSIENVGNGWYRCAVEVDIGSASTANTTFWMSLSNLANPTLNAGISPTYTGDGTSGILLWGVQVETGSAATAYIPTTTASVTRSADLAHVLDSSITSWGDPGALVVHFYPPGKAGTILSTDDVANEQLGIQASTTTAARAFWSGGNTATGTIGTGVQKAVHYWNGTNSRFCINGGTVQTGTNNITTFGNIDFVTFGAEATESGGVPVPPPPAWQAYANCIIRKIEFYSGTLTDANLQTITT